MNCVRTEWIRYAQVNIRLSSLYLVNYQGLTLSGARICVIYYCTWWKCYFLTNPFRTERLTNGSVVLRFRWVFFLFFNPPVGTCKVIWQREVDYDYKNVIYIHFKDLFWTHNKRKRYKVISVEKVESGGITIMCLLLSLWFQNESLKWIQIILFLIMQVTRVM